MARVSEVLDNVGISAEVASYGTLLQKRAVSFFSVQFSSLIAALSFGSCSGVGQPGEVLVNETPRMSAPFLHVLHLYREGARTVSYFLH